MRSETTINTNPDRDMNAMRGAQDPHAGQGVVTAGATLATAPYVMLLVHGRGGSAEGMLPIARAAGASEGAILAPRAAGGSWYPSRFLAPTAENEPWLSSALAAIDASVQAARSAGVPSERIILCGFSQGACLMLEYAARSARTATVRFGGVAAFAGGLIGADDEQVRAYAGSLAGTPVLLSVGDADEHIPVTRVQQAAELFTALDAAVDTRVYPRVGHSIVGDQLDALRAMLDGVRASIPAG
jgi:phospholipase/carboxylesterase